MLRKARSVFGRMCANPAAHLRIKATFQCSGSALLLVLVLPCECPAQADGQLRADTPPTVTAASSSSEAAILEASERFGIPASWIRAVVRVESGGNALAVSPKGAIGLMQIMPDTWAGLRLRYQLGGDPFDSHDNILGGAAYLRELHDRFGSGGFLAAYNAGPARYEAYLTAGRPLADETRLYLAKLASLLPDLAIDPAILTTVAARDWRNAGLFTGIPVAQHPADLPSSGRQFIGVSSDVQPSLPSRLAPASSGLFVAVAVAGVK